MDATLEDLRNFIAYRVLEGFESVHEIVEDATEYALGKHGRDDLQPSIKAMLAELLAAHRTEQAGWESSTDCDRLDEAFAALNQHGIVARQDFSCCNNCGFTDIWDEIEKEEERQPVTGYVFYHLQGTAWFKTTFIWVTTVPARTLSESALGSEFLACLAIASVSGKRLVIEHL
jgi:hypothetical protein